MPTIKPGSKDETKAIAAQVTTPRRARKKGKKSNAAATSPDKNSTISGVGGSGGCGRSYGLENSPTEDTKQTRSRSRGRKILDAAVARISFGRSRSKSIPKSNSRGIEISGPIVGTRITSEVFGPSVFLKQNSATEPDQNGHVSASHDQTNGQTQFPFNSTVCLNPAEREQLLRTPQSWEGNSNDGSLSSIREPRPLSHQSSFQHSPEMHVANQRLDRPTILSRLVSRDPRKPDAICNVCSQRITDEDRYDIIDQIMHRYCFKCALCGSGLINRSAVCHNGTWSCAGHFQFNVNSIDNLAC